MAMRVRNDVMPFWTGVNAKMLTRASKLVAAVTSFPVQYNKAIVGRNAFAHESGIHQDGMLKHTQTYEILVPEDVGVKQTSLVMGKHSGRHAFAHKLEEFGYYLGNNQLEEAFVRFKALADRKKHVYDEDIEALVDNGIAAAQKPIKPLGAVTLDGSVVFCFPPAQEEKLGLTHGASDIRSARLADNSRGSSISAHAKQVALWR